MKNRIKELREAKELSQPALARAAGTTKQTIGRLEKGQRPLTQGWMERLAPLLGCNPWELITTETQIVTNKIEERQISEEINITQLPRNRDRTFVNTMVPVYGAASAASPELVRFTEEFMIDQTMPHPAISNTRDAFAMQVQGDSMSPRREHGELIYIHPHQEPLIGQDCVVVDKTEGNAIYKRYMGRTKDNKGVILKQFNPEKEIIVPLSKIRKVYKVIF